MSEPQSIQQILQENSASITVDRNTGRAPENERFIEFLEKKDITLNVSENPPALGGFNKLFYAETARFGQKIRLDDFPEDAQEFIRSCKDLDIIEKMNVINTYVNEHISYEDQSKFDPSPCQTAGDTLKTGLGDCDDMAYVKGAMLELSGVDPSQINVVGATVGYTASGKRPDFEGHTLVIVDVGKDHYVMDGNTTEVVPLNDELETSRPVNMFYEENNAKGKPVMQINKILSVNNQESGFHKSSVWENIEPDVKIPECKATAPSMSIQ